MRVDLNPGLQDDRRRQMHRARHLIFRFLNNNDDWLQWGESQTMDLFRRKRWKLTGIGPSGKLLQQLWNAKTIETAREAR